ncbi:hypothetical protein P280DRAFT_442297 [Massarina eburnea CBS 473.64]|uniref:GILT-domain-containing protein n=1 Tax=Massarina eburnea CBS 473.64 TaxID=1395130 RepID=A0A6A6SEU4_9PLEO|nr:hypothetical protein P280DRAFT_442297 [Massarina eburnea CBS 473.64]
MDHTAAPVEKGFAVDAEKAALLPPTPSFEAAPIPSRPARYLIALVLFFGLFTLSLPHATSIPLWPGERHEGVAESKVPLEVHIMSKCPDARDCLEKLVVPAMANVSDKVDFRLSFIGKTTEDDGVQCMHGQTECLANIVELCAASEYPDPKTYLGFTMCLEHDYQQLPKQSFIEECALEHGISFEKLNDCMSKDDGAYGMGMLRDSVTRSKDMGVRKSCTVRLDGKTRCVMDDGKWEDCGDGSEPDDLIKDIEKLYKA